MLIHLSFGRYEVKDFLFVEVKCYWRFYLSFRFDSSFVLKLWELETFLECFLLQSFYVLLMSFIVYPLISSVFVCVFVVKLFFQEIWN